MLRRHGRDEGHAAAEIRARRARLPAFRRRQTATPRCASPRRWRATGGRPALPCSRPNNRQARTKNHGLHAEQRAARLADDRPQVRGGGNPPDLARTRRDFRPARDLRLGDRQEGFQARLPHHGGAEGMGRPRHRFRDPGAGDGRARQGRQRDLEDFQPMLEVEPPDRRHLHRRAEGPLPQAVPGGRHLSPRQGHQRAERGLRQPAAAGRRSQGRAQIARRAPGRRMDPQRREVLHRQCQRRQAVLHRCPHRPQRPVEAGHHHVPGAARHAGLPHRQGVQQGRLALLPERRDDLRERPRAACQRRGPRERLRHEDRTRPATAPAATCSATSSSPPTRSASATTPARWR